MSPFRLIFLSILLYILYRLIFGPGKQQKKPNIAKGEQPDSFPAQDVLVEDPVCHTYIPMGQAIHLQNGKETIHFCSEQCRESFLKKKGD
ncbi:MAG: TRASH domain protein [Proteobacteria bacterium]|nr:TRASH domain protein [Pseudomonadota bacterium]MBU1709718.1 TRASH domain protein [Pseudomonadota bacterium]